MSSEHLILVFFFFFTAANAQEDEKPNQSKSEYIAKTIDSLNLAIGINDIQAIVRHAGDLTTNFQNARMPKEAHKYLEIAKKFAEQDSSLLAGVYNRAGMLALMYTRSENESVISEENNIDSAIYWHRKGIELGIRFNQPGQIGFNYNGLLQAMVDPTETVKFHSDSIQSVYLEGLKYAQMTSGFYLEHALHKLYAVHLITIGELEEAEIILNGIVGNFDKLDAINRMSLYAWVFRLIAKQNDLDTLIRLSEIQNREFVKATASEHELQLYEADKKFETTLTKNNLALSQAKVQYRDNIILVFAGVLMLAAMTFIYLYNLNKRNVALSKRNELLVREQNHRVKNNLQMISSLLSLQAGKAQDEVSKDALKQSQGRIQAIALLNRSLYDQEEIGDIDLKVYISELITEVINSITDTEVKYHLDIDEIKLDLEKTTSLGLIINELIVNSVKYVKQSVTEFNLSIKEQSGKFSLEYSDNGENFDLLAYQNSKSFGKKLVELQAKQLRGQQQVKFKSGFYYNLAF
jgi:two-component sensor histidine kinase